MRIIQLVLWYGSGDGVGNCLKSLSVVFDKLCIENIIWAAITSEDIVSKKVSILKKDDFDNIKPDDILIYHFSIGCALNKAVEKLNCKKILVYHNVTPAHFFESVDMQTYLACLEGEKDALNTVGHYLKCIVPSGYSKRNLVEMGWKAEDISVIPFYNVDDTQVPYSENIAKRYEGITNFLFTGRIAPNKKIEDVIKIFDYYQKNYDSSARLFITGGANYPLYYEYLEKVIISLRAENIIFTGRIPQEELEAYYRVASIYLSMSEHEGFCLPLLEAMKKNVVVVAYDAAAVGDTMGSAGILLNSKKEEAVCEKIRDVLSNENYQKKILRQQKKHVDNYSIDQYVQEIRMILDQVNDAENTFISNERVIAPVDIENVFVLRNRLSMLAASEVVIYGIGNMGKQCYEELKIIEESYDMIILDNGLAGGFFNGRQVYDQSTCISKYKNAVYIVTIQSMMPKIVFGLLKEGIKPEQILLYYYNTLFKYDAYCNRQMRQN